MKTRTINIQEALDRLQTAAKQLERPVTFMEVCGTHTMSAFRCGLHSLMPENVTLLSGPGCPVCVTSQGDIDLLIEVTVKNNVTLCTYGDMMRVPGQLGSLEQARSHGADVQVIYSAMDAMQLAQQHPEKEVVFAAIGFETTTPPTAVAVTEAKKLGLKNFTVLVSHKLVIPAMTALLEGVDVNVDGFLCPGHVSVIIGSEVYRPIVDKYKKRCVISGFEDVHMTAALARITEQARDNQILLENLYPQAVTPKGNQVALDLIFKIFEPADMSWRGLTQLPKSGLKLRKEYEDFDAELRFGLVSRETPEPAGCRCGDVITGRCQPDECKLFSKVCTPVHPIGPCMVSSEGTCQAWFKYHQPQSRLRKKVAL